MSEAAKRMKKKWIKLPAIELKDLHIGCVKCSTARLIADIDMQISVGFGAAHAEKDGVKIYDGESDFQRGRIPKTIRYFESLAVHDPDHDWRVVKIGPLHGETFQRQGKESWVCVESNKGFS